MIWNSYFSQYVLFFFVLLLTNARLLCWTHSTQALLSLYFHYNLTFCAQSINLHQFLRVKFSKVLYGDDTTAEVTQRRNKWWRVECFKERKLKLPFQKTQRGKSQWNTETLKSLPNTRSFSEHWTVMNTPEMRFLILILI